MGYLSGLILDITPISTAVLITFYDFLTERLSEGTIVTTKFKETILDKT